MSETQTQEPEKKDDKSLLVRLARLEERVLAKAEKLAGELVADALEVLAAATKDPVRVSAEDCQKAAALFQLLRSGEQTTNKYMRRTTIVDAVQFVDKANPPRGVRQDDDGFYVINRAKVKSRVEIGDWVVQDSDGEHYAVMKDASFRSTYASVQ